MALKPLWREYTALDIATGAYIAIACDSERVRKKRAARACCRHSREQVTIQPRLDYVS